MLRLLNRALDKFADTWGAFFSSKWTVLLFALLPLIAIGEAVKALLSGDFVTFVGWLSSNYLQLIALPVLAYIAKRTEQSHQLLHDKIDDAHGKLDALAKNDEAA